MKNFTIVQKVVSILFLIALIIECCFFVPFQYCETRISEQNVPHTTKYYTVYSSLLWKGYYATPSGKSPGYCYQMNETQLLVQTLIITGFYIVLLIIFGNRQKS